MNIAFRTLGTKDRSAYHELLLQALKDEPYAFGSSYEEALSSPPEKWLTADHNDMTIGAFDDEQLIGAIGLYRIPLKKMIHVTFIKAMYIDPGYRDRGCGKDLLTYALDYAKNKMKAECAKLWVVKNDTETHKFYEKCGFTVYGVDPKAIRINGKFFDEYLMWKDFGDDNSE